MSQAGKVLHLYVEVRSVAEEEGKVLGRRDDGTGHLMLLCPDVLPHSRSSLNHSPELSPASQHHTGVGGHSVPPSKSPSRHSVLAPGATSPSQHGSLMRTRSSDMDPYRGRGFMSPSSTPSERLTVPSTPTSHRRSYDVPRLGGEEGKTSVVTFGYIEKANVHSMGGHRTSLYQSELDGQLRPAHLQKRLSDPVWYNGQPGQGDAYLSHPYPSQNQSPRGSPYMQRATLDVARDATYRALEEFGSPELRRRFVGYSQENRSPTLPRHYQSPRCRSWTGSPVLPRSTHTLPSKAHPLELDRGVCRSPVNGLPRSPASDHLSAHTSNYSYSAAPTSTPRSHGLPQQRSWVGDESPRLHHAATSQSPVLDPRQRRGTSPTKDMTTLHRYQLPQYTGSRKSPGMELRPYDHHLDRSPRDSPELSRRFLSSQNTEALPVSWTSRHQEWREAGSTQHGDELCDKNYSRQSTSGVYTPRESEETKE
ncbi:hypothetical protein D5F01_LYC24863 [Larimichthys crocea]|uniref:Uncharacterized protein n=1 Tax=Larimichthys crocea TaxID=215358 RepID=A0A6G0HDG0_LARCR|nr:hypothetical protein D5F01_LYC24863 [Larimichthys crocea]